MNRPTLLLASAFGFALSTSTVLAQNVAISPGSLDRLLAGTRAAEWVWDKYPALTKYYECSHGGDNIWPEIDVAMVKYLNAQDDGNKTQIDRTKKALDAAIRKNCGPRPASWDDEGPQVMHTKIAAKAARMTEDDFEWVRDRTMLFLIFEKNPAKVLGSNAEADFTAAERAAFRSRLPQLRAALAKDLKYDSPI